MTLNELIKELQTIASENNNGDRIVILSSDGGGNLYSPLHDYELIGYLPENDHIGYVAYQELTPELINTAPPPT